tara:strand:- start:340 stop:477 length:138 start_codon:yes stop_codon:yes gene_type:complete
MSFTAQKDVGEEKIKQILLIVAVEKYTSYFVLINFINNLKKLQDY